jgi:hypothetical protein
MGPKKADEYKKDGNAHAGTPLVPQALPGNALHERLLPRHPPLPLNSANDFHRCSAHSDIIGTARKARAVLIAYTVFFEGVFKVLRLSPPSTLPPLRPSYALNEPFLPWLYEVISIR